MRRLTYCGLASAIAGQAAQPLLSAGGGRQADIWILGTLRYRIRFTYIYPMYKISYTKVSDGIHGISILLDITDLLPVVRSPGLDDAILHDRIRFVLHISYAISYTKSYIYDIQYDIVYMLHRTGYHINRMSYTKSSG